MSRGAIVGAERVLDALLMVLDQLGLEARDLLGERRREIEIADCARRRTSPFRVL